MGRVNPSRHFQCLALGGLSYVDEKVGVGASGVFGVGGK
ncbi:Uncharacterised protein [Chlamydia abortus]|nr:Uncharacterised protein [Chlamydia abortus]